MTYGINFGVQLNTSLSLALTAAANLLLLSCGFLVPWVCVWVLTDVLSTSGFYPDGKIFTRLVFKELEVFTVLAASQIPSDYNSNMMTYSSSELQLLQSSIALSEGMEAELGFRTLIFLLKSREASARRFDEIKAFLTHEISIWLAEGRDQF